MMMGYGKPRLESKFAMRSALWLRRLKSAPNNSRQLIVMIHTTGVKKACSDSAAPEVPIVLCDGTLK